MGKIISYEENEAHIINICKKIRKFAKLDRMTLDISEHQDSRNTHLFRFLDYCGVDKEKFVKSYLSNLQPYMLSRNTEQEKADNTICVLDNIYRISLYVKLNTQQGNEMIVSFHEDHKRGISKDNSRFIKKGSEKVKIIADSITGGITDTNIKTFDILVPRGVINIPISLTGELQTDNTFLVNRNAIDNAILSVCNQYIQDLYTSNLELPLLDEVELFSALQQISFTSYGNSVFSNISVLIDNMSVQNSPLHKASASFALETYVSHLILTSEQKSELIELIRDKYTVACQKDISAVTDMIIDIIDNLDTDMVILDSQIEPSKIEDKEPKNDDDNSHKPQGPSAGVSSNTEKIINAFSELAKDVKGNVKKIISEEKTRVQHSFEHISRQIKHSFGLSR